MSTPRIEIAEAPPPTEEISHPELTDRLLLAALDSAKVGDDILNKTGTLVRLPSLEGRKFRIPLDLIMVNPNQPRTRFDEAGLRELADSIFEIGQKDPVKVIPFSNGDRIGLFLEDGERRYRAGRLAGLRYVLAEVVWAKDEDELHETSFILNVQRAKHTPMEIARALRRMIDANMQRQKCTQPEALAIVSKRTGYSLDKIKGYLEFLKYPESVQTMLHEGTLRPSHVLQLRTGHKKGKMLSAEDLQARMELAARQVLDFVEGRKGKEDEIGQGKRSGRITLRDIARMRKGVQIQEIGEEAMGELAMADALLKARSAAATFLNKTGLLLDPEKRALAITSMRNMGEGKPPEVLRDLLEKAAEAAIEVLGLAETAIKPPPLEIPEGKPLFQKYIRIQPEGTFGGIRLNIALVLAEASDNNGSVMTIPELAHRLNTEENSISGNITLLRSELRSIGIVLEPHDVRVKAPRGTYEKIMGYRLAWPREELKRQTRRIEEKREPLKIRVEVSPHLEQAATKIAEMIASQMAASPSLTLNPGTSFGEAVGVRLIEHDAAKHIFIVESNVHAFPLNFSSYQEQFARIICENSNVPAAKVRLLREIRFIQTS